MNYLDLVRNRHSVRKFKDLKIQEDKKNKIKEKVRSLNEESGLNFQVFFDEPKCFKSKIFTYGSFKNANNYISLVGEKSTDLGKKIGYFGQDLLLFLQDLGLNTCWVGLTHGKSMAKINKNEKEVCLIAFAYGDERGNIHKSKDDDDLSNIKEFYNEKNSIILEFCKLAPTALNQQKFYLEFKDDGSYNLTRKMGPYSKVDFGIIKYHLDLAEKYWGEKNER